MARKRKSPGRPKLPASERKPLALRHRAVNTTLAPEVWAYAERLGDGSASRGVRLAVMRDMERATGDTGG